ncbi:MAG TPA: preprotein translocase subunit SecE [Caulobacteraceae bacterium]|jgi:preprotein translocase subunit SecE
MAKDQGAIQTTLRPRTPAKLAEPPKKRTSVVQFFREVRAEARKVTWTSWKETWITSVMVGIMVVVVAMFFFGIDTLFGVVMNQVLKLGSPGQ